MNRGLLSNDLSKEDQSIIKDLINIGRANGRPQSANEIIDEIGDRGIKVNLK